MLKRTRGKGISKNVAQTVAIKQNEEPPKIHTTTTSDIHLPECNMYDYIIVGAGPSGSIVANKLHAANNTLKILVLEAGIAPPDDPVFTDPL